MIQRIAEVLTVLALAGLGAHQIRASERRIDPVTSHRYVSSLSDIVALEAQLLSEVLEARSGSAGNYDRLVALQQSLDRVQRSAGAVPGFLSPAQRAALESAVDDLRASQTKVNDRVERFKSKNAVLRNSLLFLPAAARGLDAVNGAAEGGEFEAAANALVRDVLLLHAFGDPSIRDRAARRLEHMPAPKEATGQDDQGRALVLRHAEVVLTQLPVVDALVREIKEARMVQRAENLAALYQRERQVASQLGERDMRVAFALVLLAVLSGAASLLLRSRRATLELRRTTGQLRETVVLLQVEQAKQQELSELKNRFVSMTSHQFRTPLGTILSSSEMLEAYEDRWPAEKKASHFARIKTCVLDMMRMLDAVLLIGTNDAGRLAFNPARLDLSRFCAEVVEAASRSCPDHEVAFEAPELQEDIVADETLLRHVAENLLSNAIKYSPRGGKVEFVVRRDGADIVFDVRDRGIGIPEADQPRLFETFHRGSNVGNAKGSGLGLSIVKRAVLLHGGTIQLRSAVGEGTEFTVRIPCPRAA
jgi:signal transduction histidine kinase